MTVQLLLGLPVLVEVERAVVGGRLVQVVVDEAVLLAGRPHQRLQLAHLQAPHLVRFAGLLDDLLDGGSSGLHTNRLRRIA